MSTNLRRRAMLGGGSAPSDIVDFGLSVKWSKYNLAGDKLTDNESDYGYYYQWAGTTGYQNASTHTFSSDFLDTPYYNKVNGYYFTKYVTNLAYGPNIDNKTTLESGDDPVTALLGSEYRMPTSAEFLELFKQCGSTDGSGTTIINASTYTVKFAGVYWLLTPGKTIDGVTYKNPGCLFVGKDITKRIFLPAAGYCSGSSTEIINSRYGNYHGCFYWARSSFTDSNPSFLYGNSSIDMIHSRNRSYGHSIRGVKVSGNTNDNVVDFGLSVKWLKYNLAGDKLTDDETDYGYYYQWGSTTGYQNASTHTFDLSTTPYCTTGSYTYWSKYVTNSTYGTVDNKTTLESWDDPAIWWLGSEYRTPTYTEFQELYNHCGGANSGSLSGTTSVSSKGTYWVAAGTTVNGIKYTNPGRLFVGQDVTKRVFFPASGYCMDSSVSSAGSTGRYWASSLQSNNTQSAYSFEFASGSVSPTDNSRRFYGYPIRPVKIV